MKDMSRSILKIVGVLFGVLVLGFTGFQTWSLLYEVSSNHAVAALGLVLFEGSLLYWWFFFQNEAEGLPQMGLSLLVAMFGLLLVSGSTALHLGAIEGGILGASTPSKLVTIAAIVNLVAKFTSPLLHPEMMKRMHKKAMAGKILVKTFALLESKTDDMAQELANEVASDWSDELRLGIRTSHISRPELPAFITPPIGYEDDKRIMAATGSKTPVVLVPKRDTVIDFGDEEQPPANFTQHPQNRSQ